VEGERRKRMTSLALLDVKPKRRKPQRPEQELQKACVAYLRSCVPAPPVGPFWFAVPNGYYRTKAEAGIAKAMGVRAGVPDLILIWRGRCIAIEFKAPKGTITMEQLGAQAELNLCGALVNSDCRSLDAFKHFLEVAGIPCRGRIAA
jgi:hypothetical protein